MYHLLVPLIMSGMLVSPPTLDHKSKLVENWTKNDIGKMLLLLNDGSDGGREIVRHAHQLSFFKKLHNIFV